MRPDVVLATETIATEALLECFSYPAAPLLAKMEATKVESRTLSALRDLLLPKLMSGEISVKNAEKFVGEAT